MSIEISKLSNGLTIATDSMPDAQSVALGVWVGVGTRDEAENTHGIAHLVEHMLFKGTPTRSAIAISEAMENVGGYLNAYTTREETAYHARVLPDHTPLAVEILADMLQRSVIDPHELDRERTVIIQEIGQSFDTPDDHVFDLAQALAFPQQGLGASILGTEATVAGAPRAALVGYLEDFYRAGNMFLVAAGRVTHDAIHKLAVEHFAGLGAGGRPVRTHARYVGGAQKVMRELEQLHIVLGFPAPDYFAPDYHAAQLLAMVLGGGSASRLFKEVREKRGLAYSVSAFGQSWRDAGMTTIYAGTAPDKGAELLSVVWGEIHDLARRVELAELARAKAQLRAGMLMGQESAQARCDQLAAQLLLWGRAISMPERLAKLEAVTPDQLSSLAAQMTPERQTLIQLGEG